MTYGTLETWKPWPSAGQHPSPWDFLQHTPLKKLNRKLYRLQLRKIAIISFNSHYILLLTPPIKVTNTCVLSTVNSFVHYSQRALWRVKTDWTHDHERAWIKTISHVSPLVFVIAGVCVFENSASIHCGGSGLWRDTRDHDQTVSGRVFNSLKPVTVFCDHAAQQRPRKQTWLPCVPRY